MDDVSRIRLRGNTNNEIIYHWNQHGYESKTGVHYTSSGVGSMGATGAGEPP